MNAVYLIWSHEHGSWWGPREYGYTRRLSDAGRYSRKDALRICADAIRGDRSGILPELPVREADVFALTF